jgi:hypothetical protein
MDESKEMGLEMQVDMEQGMSESMCNYIVLCAQTFTVALSSPVHICFPQGSGRSVELYLSLQKCSRTVERDAESPDGNEISDILINLYVRQT